MIVKFFNPSMILSVFSKTLLLVVIILLSTFLSIGAQEDVVDNLQKNVRLKNEAFLRSMITMEAFLLGIVKSVNDELIQRHSEGLKASDLGIEDFMTPEEVLLDEYMDEFQRISEILDQIEELESLAKRQVHMAALEVLASLRERVSLLLQSGPLDSMIPNAQEQVAEASEVHEIERLATEVESADPFDLFEQWKYNRRLDYELKLTEYKLFRSRLLQSADENQETRMFQRYLRVALENYQIGDFSLARLQLRDVLETYSNYTHMDDVLYYSSEASYGLNYLDEASEDYLRLTLEYPDSPFANRALMKLIYIDYIYRNHQAIFEHYDELLRSTQELDAESMGAISYLVGHTHFKLGRYEEAETPLARVSASSTYYFPALYLSAACYSNLGNDDLALSIYDDIVMEDPRGKDEVFAQIQNNSLLKLGMIYYERGDHETATAYFDLVSQNFDSYELSVMGRAWSAYRSGKPGEALMNAEWILRNSMLSKYSYEARILAARSKELLGHPEEAIADLKDAFRIGQRADEILPDLPGRTLLSEEMDGIQEKQQYKIAQRERDMLLGAQEVRRFLSALPSKDATSATDVPQSEANLSITARLLTEKIDALDGMEVQASTGSSDGLVDDIRLLRSDFIQTLYDHSGSLEEELLDSEEDPLIQRMGMTEYLKYTFQHLLQLTLDEKENAKAGIQEARSIIAAAQNQDNTDIVIRTEIQKKELEDHYGRLNQYEIWLLEHMPEEFRVELNQWAAFSGYGISNINFSRIREMDVRISRISETIESLDHVYESKRKNLENRIRGLLSDVSKIEQQMQQEAERRDQRERERFFNTEYFDRQRQETSVGRLREEPVIKE